MTRGGRRIRRLGLAIAVAAPLAVILAPEAGLACREPYLTETQPGGRWSVTVCGRPQFFAMPGGGSDAPGWIVLRDDHGVVRGVSSLDMLQLYGTTGGQTEWTTRSVSRSMVFELPLVPAQGRIERWWDEQIWRLRALTGLTPDDEDLH